jgi:hypothetical protein
MRARVMKSAPANIRARPPIERVVALLREAADRIGKMVESPFRLALNAELNNIADSVVDIAARLPAPRRSSPALTGNRLP